ncbi:unnamed protein product [Onchocerca flexuosa]|uniref:Lyase_1 domain-containing protein n=1 Tax=Onchocerca flexuosa TaxID=387005 RepID=A0A183HAR6_9BILA|nr:unnamed protein product [Onchocerca flexuosa]
MDEFFKIKSEINATLLCNTVDMKLIGKTMCQIIDLGEKYINEMEKENEIPNCLLLRNIAAYIISLLNTVPKDIDNVFPVDFSGAVGCGTASNTFPCDLIMPYVSALTVFRETISELAQQHNVNDIIKVIILKFQSIYEVFA